MQGLTWETIHLPLAAGVNQSADDRALPPPSLQIAKDLQFDEDGGLQTRHPFASVGSDIFGGGTISSARRIVQNGDEKLLFTDDTLYSWNAQLSKWVSRGTHLAVATEERPVFVTAGDQVAADRAELAGTVLYVWVDGAAVWAAAADKSTGSVLMAPTMAKSTGSRPRLVALSTKILLFWINTSNADLECISIDPAAPATAVAGAATTVVASTNDYYDVVKIPSADTAIGAAGDNASYTAFKLTAALALTTSAKARTDDGPLAVSCDPTGAEVQIVRMDATLVYGDLLTVSSLADVYTAQAIGASPPGTLTYQVAAAHRSVQDSGEYRCFVFWHADENSAGTPAAGTFVCQSNWVDTGNNIGTAVVMLREHAVASRAFDYDGRVFVWVAFGGESSSFTGGNAADFRAQLQNSYFLYRDDGTLHAKSVWLRGGGFPGFPGHLPNVGLVSGTTGFAWAAIERRVISLGGNSHIGYGDRGPRDVTFTFDDNRARRCVRLGSTLYLAGGEVLQYDGVQLAEVGFHEFPYNFALTVVASGNLENGTYTYRATPRWDSAVGERDRGTTATHISATVSAGPDGVSIAAWSPIFVTHKTSAVFEMWRTAKNPSADAPFYLVTAQDPADTSNPNRYIPNDTTAATLATLNDEFADSTLATKESSPENGSVLENLAPPPATIIAAYGSRVFLGGVAGDARRIWYSKLRGEGEVVAFHDQNAFELPLEGGDLVAIGFLDGTLVAFCETATFIVPGDGYDNLGGGANYGPARAVSYDVGCRDHDSVATTPMGLVFQSAKGRYLLNRGLALTYIGGPVSDYDSETVLACHVDEKRHHVRWLTASRMLVWDYKARSQDNQGQWAEWTISDGAHAAVLGGTYHYLTSTGPKSLSTAHTSLTYGLDAETAWIKPADLQGFSRIRHMMVLGEFRSAHYLRVRISYNYNTTVVDDRSWTVTPTTVGGPLQVKIFPTRPQCQAIKLRLTAVAASTIATATGLSTVIVLSVGNWTATLTGVVPRTFTTWFLDGATASVEVRDNETHNGTTWSASSGCCGVLVTGRNTTAPVTIATVEAAINASSSLVSVTSAHGTPSSTIDFATMAGTGTTAAAFAAASPTGEGLKLTGLALEVGLKRGLHRRLPVGQRT